MARKYALAQALPFVRRARGLRDPEGRRMTLDEALAELRRQRAGLRDNPNALRALDRFLEAAGLLDDVQSGS
jgi:hypothetical protein